MTTEANEANGNCSNTHTGTCCVVCCVLRVASTLSLSLFEPRQTVAPRVLCRDAPHLNMFKEAIISGDGEGVILRRADSPYVPGRAPYLIKLKVCE